MLTPLRRVSSHTLEALEDRIAPADVTAPASSAAIARLGAGSVSTGPEFTVTWSGADEAGGSGIDHYDVYFSGDGGAYQLFASGTTRTAYAFTGAPGHTYAFYSVATDVAGNREDAPASPDVTVSVHEGTILNVSAGHPLHLLDASGAPYTISITGEGGGTVELEGGVPTGADVRFIYIIGTDATSTLKVTATPTASVTVGRIISMDSREMHSVLLSSGVTLGDGLDDGQEDLGLGGAVKTLTLGDIGTHALLDVGLNLDSVVAARTATAVTLGSIFGPDVTAHFGLKLGKVSIRAWDAAGTLTMPYGAAGLSVAAGDFLPSVDLDTHGAFDGTAKLGSLTIARGGLLSPDFGVEGTIGPVHILRDLNHTNVYAAGYGPVSVGGMTSSTLVATGGGIASFASTGALLDSTIDDSTGHLGSVSIQLAGQIGAVTAMGSAAILADSLGPVSVSVSGGASLYSATGLAGSAISVAGGKIASLSVNLHGSQLTQATGLTDTTVFSAFGLGKVNVAVTSGAAAPVLIGLNDTTLNIAGDTGPISIAATGTAKHPTGGQAIAVQSDTSLRAIISNGTIASFTARATGTATATAMAGLGGGPVTLLTFGALGPVTISATGAETNMAAQGLSLTGTTGTGAIAFTGGVQDSYLSSHGKIASLVVKNGGLSGSTVAAGVDSGVPSTRAQLLAASLGPVTIAGEVSGSTISATGNVGAVTVASNFKTSALLAGADPGANLIFGTEDTYNAHGSIASVKIAGALIASTLAAGIDPGNDNTFGSADDTAGTAATGLALRSHLGPIVLGAQTVAPGTPTPFAAPPTQPHSAAIESLALTSIKLGKYPLFHNFTSPVWLDANGDSAEQTGEALIRKLGA